MKEQLPRVITLDNDWPGRALTVMPGDLSKWLNCGGGQAAEAHSPDDVGLVFQGTGPILMAPPSVPGGGVVYFDDKGALERLPIVLELMGVYRKTRSYAVFWGVTPDPHEDRYLQQARILTHSALRHTFKATEAEALEEQPIPLGAYIERFIEEQRAEWNDGRTYSRRLDGVLGGDADSAREKLGFGFAVERPYAGVYRLWSRPWLCSK